MPDEKKDELLFGRRVFIGTLKCRIAALESEVSTLESERNQLIRERDALIAAWPVSDGYSGPILYQSISGTWWLETVARDRRTKRGGHGPYPTRDAAVRAAAGLPPETNLSED